jgi:hypothetical protein
MMFRLIVFLIALALTPTSLLAGPRTVAPTLYSAALSSDLPVVNGSGKTISAVIVVASKPCSRGALPLAPCAPDIGLPASGVAATATFTGVGFECITPVMAGLSAGCLVGPPRFG